MFKDLKIFRQEKLETTAQKIKFSIKDFLMWPNPQFPADSVTFFVQWMASAMFAFHQSKRSFQSIYLVNSQNKILTGIFYVQSEKSYIYQYDAYK